jgi:hypothetical protein
MAATVLCDSDSAICAEAEAGMNADCVTANTIQALIVDTSIPFESWFE